MRIAIILLFTWCVSLSVCAQRTDEVFERPQERESLTDGDKVYKDVDVMPKFKGGINGLVKYLGKIKYPEYARERDWEGTVYVNFVVNKAGHIENVTIGRSSGYEILDETAVAYIKDMKKFKKPGYVGKKPVKVQFTVPIRFNLN